MLLNNACFSKPTNEHQLAVCVEAIKVVETLVQLTQDNLRVHLLGVLIPILISLLASGPPPSKHAKTLHDHALQRLMKIGPQYPHPFKAIMTSAPELKQQLEAAIRASQASSKAKAPSTQPKAAPAAPSIKLRMDFSNYK
ncbi:predicted protein [Nematostella vectensis]|uniref:HEAT repeat-containing protein 1 n=2 Tax=Nematostella vectensis TaxID=45351 RepID=A7T979_NEMVE|nr:predicted protein [Nematostella vectensis]|eukprot:XP_001619547.1 hypothetical protein NEMVEDRAFT_v1g151016 [Nematostella vectensis]